jgi:hypothetical protein
MTIFNDKLKELIEIWFKEKKVLTLKDYNLLKSLCMEVYKPKRKSDIMSDLRRKRK